eukprot:CAMPEP_0197394578 /NCGR_PEP_ID=MMETSP1165-20131217/5526_1 /TAXON_ID=284809 /ORGANISM="Chrysocystis fragilis, Strain CCMP3189" /LENGTH=227 /DNA_ID=CAMNT_0042920299 /DNA_START=33 /DNA_END=716 /DNA_ORIENTATION=-
MTGREKARHEARGRGRATRERGGGLASGAGRRAGGSAWCGVMWGDEGDVSGTCVASLRGSRRADGEVAGLEDAGEEVEDGAARGLRGSGLDDEVFPQEAGPRGGPVWSPRREERPRRDGVVREGVAALRGPSVRVGRDGDEEVHLVVPLGRHHRDAPAAADLSAADDAASSTPSSPWPTAIPPLPRLAAAGGAGAASRDRVDRDPVLRPPLAARSRRRGENDTRGPG